MKIYINLLNLTKYIFNLGTFLQFRRWEWVSSMETKICPKGSIRRTKEDCPTVTHTKRYIHFISTHWKASSWLDCICRGAIIIKSTKIPVRSVLDFCQGSVKYLHCCRWSRKWSRTLCGGELAKHRHPVFRGHCTNETYSGWSCCQRENEADLHLSPNDGSWSNKVFRHIHSISKISRHYRIGMLIFNSLTL